MSDSRQNLILISIDSLRADHCGFLGDDRNLTPAMDDLAAEGVVFENAIAPGPQTFSTMPAVFTGHSRPRGTVQAYPGSTHWERRLAAIDDHLDRYAPLPERLADLGYSTAGFSPNPWTSTASGFDRAFDLFEDFNDADSGSRLTSLLERLPAVTPQSKRMSLALDMLTGRSFFRRWETFYEDIEAVRSRLTEPYFLWIFLLDTHYPYLPSPTHREEQSRFGMYASAIRSSQAMRGHGGGMSERARQSMQRSYRDTVRSVDGFLARLREDSVGDDPAIILHSDHGESFGEHGNFGHHHREVYEENVHVPYVVHNAGNTGRMSAPASLATIPTVALSVAESQSLDASRLTRPTVVTSSECGTNQAVRRRRFKYIERDDEHSLFDLGSDPLEQQDLGETHLDTVERARARLARYQAHAEETEALSRTVATVAARAEL